MILSCNDYYESIQIDFELGDLSDLNIYQNDGWKLIAFFPTEKKVILERHWIKENPMRKYLK
jgi:hypothetical protein